MIFGVALRQAALAATLASEAPPAVLRETIVVVADRGAEAVQGVPAAVSSLEPQDVERLPAQTLAEWVDLVPGVQILFASDFGGTPMSSARGFFGAGEAEYLQLRLDGTPLYDAESGVADWKRLRSPAIARLEALRGAASALYGDTALAGVIDVRTAEAVDGKSRRTAWSLGSFSTLTGDGGVDLLRSRRLSLDVSASQTDGYREHSAAEERHLGFAVADPGGTERTWRLAAGWSERERGDGGPLPLAELERRAGQADDRFRSDRDDSRRRWANLRYEGYGWQATLHGMRRDGDLVRTLLLAPEIADTARRRLETRVVGAAVVQESEHLLAARPLRLRAGLDAARETLDTRYRGFDPSLGASVDARRRRLGGFVSSGLDLDERLRAVVGVRWDQVSDRAAASETHEAWSPRIGVAWRLGSAASAPSVFAQVSRSFKAATLDQLFDPRPFPDLAGGTLRISNPQLSPQRARNVELGARGGQLDERWELTLYHTTVADEIDFDPATFRYRNIGASVHDGVEAALWLRQRLGLRPFLTYAWTRVEPRAGENRGRQLKNIPRHLLRLGVEVGAKSRWSGALLARHSAGRFLDDAEQVALAKIWVIDMRVRRALRSGALHLDLLNLTDRTIPALGYVLQDLEGRAVPLAVPASGFAARAGFELRF